MAHATIEREIGSSNRGKAWPTVRGHWLKGCMRAVQHDPMNLYRNSWLEHGDYVRMRALPGVYFFLLSHPDAIDHVLHSNHKNFRKPDSFNNAIELLAGQGILRSEGDFWRSQRRLMQPMFLRQSVAKLSTHMVDSIGLMVDEWEALGDCATIDALADMMRLALRIASTTLFSTDISGDADAIGLAFRKAFEFVNLKMNLRRVFTPMWVPDRVNREFRAAKTALDRVVLDLVAQRRRETPQGDLLDLLLAAQDEQSGIGMSDEQLKDEAITLLTAAHETTGAALAWTWYLLAEHPQIQNELAEECRGRLGGRLPTQDDLPHMPLATAVFEESMRLYPPAWGLPRETIQADEINGYPLPAKATVIVSQLNAHRHPDFWSEPDRFDPTRFLPPNNANRHKFAYFPFGGGPRICIGNHFALVEGPLALAAFAQRFQLTLVPNQTIEPDPTFTLRPRYGVRVVLRKRT